MYRKIASAIRKRFSVLPAIHKMPLVIIESPYAGDIEGNVRYAREALVDSLRRGEAPIASHLLYTQSGILDDDIPGERTLGIAAGAQWYRVCDKVIFYLDKGWSPGMTTARAVIDIEKIPFELRWIRP